MRDALRAILRLCELLLLLLLLPLLLAAMLLPLLLLWLLPLLLRTCEPARGAQRAARDAPRAHCCDCASRYCCRGYR